MTAILRAISRRGYDADVIYPNTDRGHSGVVAAIRDAQTHSTNGQVRVYPSLERKVFLRKLLATDLIVGNSSAGIIEAPIAGTPTVNVGPRQEGRLRAGPSVVDCGESIRAIESAMQRARRLRCAPGRSGCYGTGRAGFRMAQILMQTRLSDALRRKRITY